MRDLHELDAYRITDKDRLWFTQGDAGDGNLGMFEVPSCTDRGVLRVIASNGDGWDHVSVSRKNRCPNWPEMSQIAAMFFRDNETAMQLHVPASDHVNNHPHCLHWWRPHGVEVPRPPAIMIGIKEAGVLDGEKARQLAAEMLG